MVEKDEQFWRNVRNLLVWWLSQDVPGRTILLQTDIWMLGTGVKNTGFGKLLVKFHFKEELQY